MEGCIFCSITQGKIPSHRVYEDDLFLAFLDINPANPGHLVLAPKAHFRAVVEMDEATYARFFAVARALSAALLEFGAQGVNYLYSMGEAAGQRSPHTILHLIPRYQNDNVHLVWEPKKIEEGEFENIRQRLSSIVGGTAQPQQPMQQVQQQPMPQQMQPQQLPQQQVPQQPQPQQLPQQQVPQQPMFQQPQPAQPQQPEEKKPMYKLPPRTGGYW